MLGPQVGVIEYPGVSPCAKMIPLVFHFCSPGGFCGIVAATGMLAAAPVWAGFFVSLNPAGVINT